MTATIYKSTDPGAPQFVDNDTASNLAILKAVLIDGYGTRTPTGGWTLAFEDVPSNIACFKATLAGGPTLQIKGTGGEQGVKARGFLTMSSATVGTGQFPTDLQVAADSYHMPMRSSTSITTPRDLWWMIVDDDGEYFYFICNDIGTVPGCCFFGKMDFSIDAERRWVIGGTTTEVNTSNCDDPLFLDNYFGNFSDRGVAPGATSGDRLSMKKLDPTIAQPNLVDSRAYFTRRIAETNSPVYYLGTFPGLLFLAGLNNNIFNGQTFLEIQGQKYLFLDTAIGNTLIAFDNE